MLADDDPRLLRLADAIGDRGPVSWDEARSADPALLPVVAGLQRVQALAEAFAAIQIPADRREPRRPPIRWGPLELLEPIGAGGFGEVVRARDLNLDREVALKLHRVGPSVGDNAGRRLMDEARRLARIRHPNVVAVYGADLCDGRVGIWTELIDGQDLGQRLAADGPLGAGEAIAIGLDLCRALAAIHAAGLVHGDVKAANVMRERGGRIVLTDLGSATEAGATPITGSPATLAPEVLAGGPATAQADLYSLGILVFQLLSGRILVDATHPEAGRTPLRDLRPDLPQIVIEVVERATDPDPDRRFQSAGAFERALAHAAEPAQDPELEAPGSSGWRITSPALWAIAALIIAVSAFGVWNARRAPASVERLTAGPDAVGAPPVNDGPQRDTAATIDLGGDAAVAGDPAADIAADLEPTARTPRALELRATMLRSTEEGVEPLAEGDRIHPGDRLALDIESSETVHVWVVNEDLDGNVFLLYPIEGLDRGNPLSAGRSHRLPGRLGGVPQHWQVTSAGGRERFLVIASRHPLPELERELADMTAVSSQEETGLHRGVGGIGPAALPGSCRLDALTERFENARQRGGAVWVHLLELVNPQT